MQIAVDFGDEGPFANGIWAHFVQTQTSELVSFKLKHLSWSWQWRLLQELSSNLFDIFAFITALVFSTTKDMVKKANFQQRILSILFGKTYIYSISLLI